MLLVVRLCLRLDARDTMRVAAVLQREAARKATAQAADYPV
jgi:hypothetical protein